MDNQTRKFRSLVIFGNPRRELCRVSTYYLGDKCIGYTADKEFIDGPDIIEFSKHSLQFFFRNRHAKYVGNLVYLNDPVPFIFLPIGYKQMNKLREIKFNQCLEWGFDVASYISPAAVIHEDIKLGVGNYIQEASRIQTGCQLGNNNTLWQNSHIGHNSHVGSHNWITTGTVICSSVVIGNNCFLGANSVICPEVELADETFIAAGAIVTKSTEKGDVFGFGQNNKLNKKSWELNLK